MGIGMVVAVKEEDAKDVVRLLEEQGEMARIIGRTIQGAGVTLMGHSTMSRLAVFASGSGSNFQSLVNAVEKKIGCRN